MPDALILDIRLPDIDGLEVLREFKQISPDTLDVIVPSMILQPLVENSIKHGLARKVGEGRITIRSVLREGLGLLGLAAPEQM